MEVDYLEEYDDELLGTNWCYVSSGLNKKEIFLNKRQLIDY